MKAFNGTKDTNPFKFEATVKSIHLTVNGRQVPSQAIELDFANKSCIRGYSELMKSLNIKNSDASNGLTLDKWMNGSTIFGFNLTADLSMNSCGHISPEQSGSMNISMMMAESTEASQLIVMGYFDTIIEIDRHRNVITDY